MDEQKQLIRFKRDEIESITCTVVSDPGKMTSELVCVTFKRDDDLLFMHIGTIDGKYFAMLDPQYPLDNFAIRGAVDITLSMADDFNWLYLCIEDFASRTCDYIDSRAYLKRHTLETIDRYLGIMEWLPESYHLYSDAQALRKALLNYKDRIHFTNKRAGWLYLIKAVMPETHYKIGLSKEPQKRIESMGVKLPFPIETLHLIRTDDRYAAEKYMHEKYGDCRVDGEWFKLSDEQVAEICKIGTLFYGGAA